MSALLKIYDDVSSNKSISLGITAASTLFMAYRTISLMYFYKDPLTCVISACAGCALAILVKIYLAHNDDVKNEGERNSIYATASLIVAFVIPVLGDSIYLNVFDKAYNNPFQWNYSYRKPFSYGSINGFGMGFLITTLAIQLMVGKTSFKLRSPFVFG